MLRGNGSIIRRDRAVTYHYVLPEPPSVNAIWKPVGTRFVLSAKYRAWIEEASTYMLAQPRPHDALTGRIHVSVTCASGPGRKDVDNMLKATLDLLESAGVLANDRDVQDLRIRRMHYQRTGTVGVTVQALDVVI